jgi:hypothetical protein
MEDRGHGEVRSEEEEPWREPGEGRAWPQVVAGSAFRVQQPGAGARDWTRTRCDDCADDWGSTSRGDGRTCGLQRFALGGA